MTETTEIAYKGFNHDLTCNGYQYEVGKEYTHEGKVQCCKSGFHACTNPFDVLDYYNMGNGNRFCTVEQSGEISKSDDDSKQASSKIKIKAEIGISGLFKAGIEWLKEITNPIRIIKETENKWFGAQIGSSGDSAQNIERW